MRRRIRSGNCSPGLISSTSTETRQKLQALFDFVLQQKSDRRRILPSVTHKERKRLHGENSSSTCGTIPPAAPAVPAKIATRRKRLSSTLFKYLLARAHQETTCILSARALNQSIPANTPHLH